MIVKMIYATIILIFAIVGMTMLLDLHPLRLPRGRRVLYFAALSFVLAASIVLMLQTTVRFAALYPLLVHLPLLVIFCVVSRRGMAKVFFVLLTMIFLSYPPALADALLMEHFSVGALTEMPVLALSCVLTLLFIRRFMQADFTYVMQRLSAGETAQFCLVPVGYNILVYVMGRYSYESSIRPFRIVLFICTMGVYSLLLRVFRRTREVERMQSEKTALSMQMEAAKGQLDALRSSQEQAVTYRHDIRHHVSLLKGYLGEGALNKISDYLIGLEADIDAITPVHYCENETVDLILSSFDARAKKVGVALCVNAALPEKLSVSDTELCALFSNALENAITAAARVEDEKLRRVYLRAVVSDGKLLLSTENAYMGAIGLAGELPKSHNSEAGHGFGIRSIVSIVERHGGLYSFETADGVFVLQLMLPLER